MHCAHAPNILDILLYNRINQCTDEKRVNIQYLCLAGLRMLVFQDSVALWLLYRCIAAGFAPIQCQLRTRLLFSSDSLRAGTEIGLLIFRASLSEPHLGP